jgi:DNA-binding transcriptional LysR family regulator
MKQLSLDNLRTFAAIVDLGGFAKAGEQLGRSQPAVSLQIKRLEQQLATRLFDKKGQRHLVNQDGLKLYRAAKELLTLNDNIFQQFQQTSLKGRLRLGIPNEFATTLLPSIIGEFGQLYPEVSLEVTSALSRQLLSDADKPNYDLIMALGPQSSFVGKDTSANHAELLLTDDLVWVGDHHTQVTSDYLPLVLAPDGCVYRSRAIDRLKRQTTQWRIKYCNADLSGITAAIKQGLGITVLAKSSVPSDLKIITSTDLPKLGTINIYLFEQSANNPKATKTLVDFIRQKIISKY